MQALALDDTVQTMPGSLRSTLRSTVRSSSSRPSSTATNRLITALASSARTHRRAATAELGQSGRFAEFPVKSFPVQRLNLPDAHDDTVVASTSEFRPRPPPHSIDFLRQPEAQTVQVGAEFSSQEIEESKRHLEMIRVQQIHNRSAFLSNNIRPQTPGRAPSDSAEDVEFLATLRKCLFALRQDAGSLNHRRWFPSSSLNLTGPVVTRTQFMQILPELLPEHFQPESRHRPRLQKALLQLLFENHPATSYSAFFSRLLPDISPFEGDSR